LPILTANLIHPHPIHKSFVWQACTQAYSNHSLVKLELVVRKNSSGYLMMEIAAVWLIKKLFLPWLAKKMLNIAWCMLRQNRKFQHLAIIMYLHWQLKTLPFKPLPTLQDKEEP
jgi:hypothetical protein